MRAALIALGRVDGRAFVPHIVQRLEYYNIQNIRDSERRRRVQMAAQGCISALEAFRDIRGYRPVFFAVIGPYEQAIQDMAAKALPNIVEDPSEAIIAIIQDQRNDPALKLTAWRLMDQSRMPTASRARVAAAALGVGWLYQTTNRNHQTNMRELRKAAITLMAEVGVSEESVYIDLEKSYKNNFINNNPDFDEIMITLNTLTAIKSEQAVNLLYKFLQEINGRRRSGPWANKERRIYEWLTACIAKTETKSVEMRLLLTTISRNSAYTSQEQTMATNALRALGQ